MRLDYIKTRTIEESEATIDDQILSNEKKFRKDLGTFKDVNKNPKF